MANFSSTNFNRKMPKSKTNLEGEKFLTSILNAHHVAATSQMPKKVQLAINVLEIDNQGQINNLYERNFSDSTRRFHLASMSKQFFGLALLQLIRDPQYEISLEDNVSSILPGWPSYASDIKIRHLLNHSSGLKEYTRNAATYLKNTFDPKSVFKFVKNQKGLLQNPGTLYLYCNTNYVLIAYIIEEISGLPIHQYMYEKIFEPLQMNQTAVRGKKAQIPKALTNYYAVGINQYRPAIKTKNDFMPGDGGVYTTIDDLKKWALFLTGKSILGSELAEEMHKALPLDS